MPKKFDAYTVHNFPLGEVRRYNGSPCAEVLDLPYYHLIPKDEVGHLRWRYYVRKRCETDKKFRRLIWQACVEDILFFINTFLFVYEPRPVGRDLPFNSWPDQDEVIVLMDECFGVRECGVEKSRGVGLSFILDAIFFHKWLFVPRTKMGLISRDSETVDKKDDMDALMPKLDYFYTWLPDWMRLTKDGGEKLDRAWSDNRRFLNVENGSSIYGRSATGDTVTGGRNSSLGMDEFAKFKRGEDTHALKSTQHVSNNRYFVSTYKGNNNEFYKLMDNKDSNMLKIVVDWKDNPERSKGMYSSRNGVLQLIDESYRHPPGYDFILDGKMRSPWYDQEWRRPGATPRGIAEELDRDPAGSVAKLFHPSAFEAQEPFIRPPKHEGDLDFDPETCRDGMFMPRGRGRLRLWVDLDGEGRPIGGGPYSLGIDIATGSGGDSSSNSSIEVIDIVKQEQVAEFYSPTVKPDALGRLTAALCFWLAGSKGQEHCLVVPEINVGVAEAYREALMAHWHHVYERRVTSERGRKKTRKLGYWNTDKGEQILIELESAMQLERTIVHSDVVIKECKQYEYRKDKVIHVSSTDSEESGVSGRAHGDCAIAYALAYHGTTYLLPAEEEQEEKPGPVEEREPAGAALPGGDWWGEYAETRPDYAHLMGWE